MQQLVKIRKFGSKFLLLLFFAVAAAGLARSEDITQSQVPGSAAVARTETNENFARETSDGSRDRFR